ncbi:hypothetical protein DM02DRAFT_657158 [Periconia macrospinosa]|uniref:Uncharacterized protein n=1 Tax=Periconia macrospinosa TaxID=97972 RepID=A0A2V1DKD4_9PLEO|nr:hypothetical protein DM02DRAFT_657158 [Periconia macrospinosa]
MASGIDLANPNPRASYTPQHLPPRHITDRMEPCTPRPCYSYSLSPTKAIYSRSLLANLAVATYDQLREAVGEAWGQVTEQQLSDLIDTLPKRMQDVIDANGGYTKWEVAREWVKPPELATLTTYPYNHSSQPMSPAPAGILDDRAVSLVYVEQSSSSSPSRSVNSVNSVKPNPRHYRNDNGSKHRPAGGSHQPSCGLQESVPSFAPTLLPTGGLELRRDFPNGIKDLQHPMGEPTFVCNFVNMMYLMSPASKTTALFLRSEPDGRFLLVRMTNYAAMLLAHLPHTGSAVRLALPRLVSDCHLPLASAKPGASNLLAN